MKVNDPVAPTEAEVMMAGEDGRKPAALNMRDEVHVVFDDNKSMGMAGYCADVSTHSDRDGPGKCRNRGANQRWDDHSGSS